jgi:RNA polymerase sigma-70 factor (ECF subfamily)
MEIEGVAVKDYADVAGISASNAGVRIFRAREALRGQVARWWRWSRRWAG